jgi:hypothetical protein
MVDIWFFDHQKSPQIDQRLLMTGRGRGGGRGGRG